MEDGLHRDIPRTRHPTARNRAPGSDPATFLVHVGPLPRPDLECLGVRTVVRRCGYHRPAISRCPDGDVRHTPATRLERKPEEAPGRFPQNLLRGLGTFACLARFA